MQKALKRAKMAKIMAQQKEADTQPSLTPEVKWAQNPEAISLTVGLGQILRPEIKINGNTLEFFASGVGARYKLTQVILCVKFSNLPVAHGVITSSSWTSTIMSIAALPCAWARARSSCWYAKTARRVTCGRRWRKARSQTFWKLTLNAGSTRMRFSFDPRKKWRSCACNNWVNRSEQWRSGTNRFLMRRVSVDSCLKNKTYTNLRIWPTWFRVLIEVQHIYIGINFRRPLQIGRGQSRVDQAMLPVCLLVVNVLWLLLHHHATRLGLCHSAGNFH